MLDAVRHVLDREQLFADHKRILIGVSGGPDSVCLTRLLVELAEDYGLTLCLGHVHHGLRGEHADADAEFVQALGRELNLPVLERRYQTESYAEEHMVSIEMAARDLRHRAFGEMLREFKGGAVALGHHRSDQAETVLFRLIWGTSPLGIGGIRARSEVKELILLRPLLSTTRKEILRWLQEREFSWCEDESNNQDGFMRNRIRHEILPAICERINPCAEEHMVRLASMIGEDADYLQQLADALYDEVEENPGELDIPRLLAAPVCLQRRVVYQWIQHCGLGRFATYLVVDHLLELCRSSEGTKSFEVNHVTFVRSYKVLRVASEYPAEPFSERLDFPGRILLKGQDLQVVVEKRDRAFVVGGQHIGQYPVSANLNPDRLRGHSLIVRSWLKGDRFAPLGMTGTKKVKDIFIDAKVPRDQRSQVPLLEVEGEILWVPGYQIARGWEVADLNSPAVHLEIDNVL